jgi:hypothetical protein|tara:strand:+ start:330 stop:551 length:222 start_codon:yes stop_codon:yes gene_type:complete
MIEESKLFCRAVEGLVSEGVYDSYIDAVLHTCDSSKIEPFMAARLISDPIKEKIKKEGQDINLLPSEAQLPFN